MLPARHPSCDLWYRPHNPRSDHCQNFSNCCADWRRRELRLISSAPLSRRRPSAPEVGGKATSLARIIDFCFLRATHLGFLQFPSSRTILPAALGRHTRSSRQERVFAIGRPGFRHYLVTTRHAKPQTAYAMGFAQCTGPIWLVDDFTVCFQQEFVFAVRDHNALSLIQPQLSEDYPAFTCNHPVFYAHPLALCSSRAQSTKGASLQPPRY